MTTEGARRFARPSLAARLLAGARFEVIPLSGIEQQVALLPSGSTVTVTASPRHGMRRTLEVSERLASLGYRVVPHLAARMIRGPTDLEEIAERLGSAGIDEAFVVGGDAPSSPATFGDAGDLLEALWAESQPRLRIGVAGYPEGHPAVSGATLLDSLRRKQPRADYITTQICFDADALVRWLNAIRSAGIELPVIVGLPGPVERRKLAEISLRAGVGASLRYLTRHHRSVVALARARRYDPTALAVAVGAHLDEPGLGIAGVHLFTFNRVEETQAWVRRMGSE